MKRTRLIGAHGSHCVTKPSRITVAGKLLCRMMKYGRAATQGKLGHQIQNLNEAERAVVAAPSPGQETCGMAAG